MQHARLKGLMLAATLSAVVPQGVGAAEFVLVNTSGVTIEQLYISSCGHRN